MIFYFHSNRELFIKIISSSFRHKIDHGILNKDLYAIVTHFQKSDLMTKPGEKFFESLETLVFFLYCLA